MNRKIGSILVGMLLCALLAGCATYSQYFINAEGEMASCSATGQGLIGMATASNAVGDCSANMLRAGYIELERAGVIGIKLSESVPGEPVRVLKAVDGAPAASAGVKAGDIVELVDGQPVSSKADAELLLFGLAGSSVAITVRRDGELFSYSLTRAPYTLVHGTPVKAARSEPRI